MFETYNPGKLPFAVLTKATDLGSGQVALMLKVLAGSLAVAMDPEWINGSTKMRFVLNVDDQQKDLIMIPGFYPIIYFLPESHFKDSRKSLYDWVGTSMVICTILHTYLGISWGNTTIS
jgi:hypothetical protein